jgi:type II secretory pathway component PulC
MMNRTVQNLLFSLLCLLLSILGSLFLFPQSLISASTNKTARDIPKSAPKDTPKETPKDDFVSFSSSEKGIEILGLIIDTNPNPKENNSTVLVKVLKSKKTMAEKIGMVLVLDEAYTITNIQKEFIELQGSRKKLRLYKYGFAARVAVEKEKVIEKPTRITGSHKEEGFNRDADAIQITEEFRKKILEKDLPKILMEAAAEPKVDANGNVVGFALYDIEKDSIFGKMGLTEGDVIKNINGEELNSAQGAVKLLNSLKGANNVNIVIERGGQSLPLTLDVK